MLRSEKQVSDPNIFIYIYIQKGWLYTYSYIYNIYLYGLMKYRWNTPIVFYIQFTSTQLSPNLGRF